MFRRSNMQSSLELTPHAALIPQMTLGADCRISNFYILNLNVPFLQHTPLAVDRQEVDEYVGVAFWCKSREHKSFSTSKGSRLMFQDGNAS